MMTHKRQLFFFTFFLLVYQVATYLANDMYVPALPYMASYFQCDREIVEWTVASFIFGSPMCILFIGPLSERFGRRRCLILSGIIFIASSLMCVAVSNIYLLILGRFIQGSVIGCIMVAGYATVQEIFHGKEAFAIIGKMTSISILAPTAGPIIGSFLMDYGSWKLSFYLVGFMAFIAIIGLYKTMPKEKRNINPQFNLSTACFYYKKLLSVPAFLLGCLLSGLVLAQFFSWITLSPEMIINYSKISVRNYGLIQIPIIGAFSFSSLAVERLIKKYTPEFLIKTGSSINLLGCLIFGISALFRSLPLIDLTVGMFLCSLGAGLIIPLINRITIMTVSSVPMDYRAALHNLLFVCVGGFCSVAMSAIYSYILKPTAFGWYLFTLGILIILCTFLRSISAKKHSPKNQTHVAQEEAVIAFH